MFPKIRDMKARVVSASKSDIKESSIVNEPMKEITIFNKKRKRQENVDPIRLEMYHTRDNVITDEDTKDDSDSNKRRGRLSSELYHLTKDDYRISKKVDIDNPSTVQLFAADFANTQPSLDAPRPKRRLKTVSRYDASGRSYYEEKELQKLQGKIGTGFLCPECRAHLGYDLKMCWKCGLECYYSAGIGVVVCKDRSEVVKSDTTTSKKVNTSNSTCKTIEKSRIKCYQTKLETVTNSSREFEDMIKSSETEECEACMQLFLPTYLQRHRRRCHQLSNENFGCPYCESKKFHSMVERSRHIYKSHPGLPTELSPRDKAKTKLYLYDCPKCTISLTYGDLRDHLLAKHEEKIVNVLKKMTCSCPFCLVKSKPDRRRFHSMDEFLSHVTIDHPGCALIGMRINIGAERESVPVQTKIPKRVKESELFHQNYNEKENGIVKLDSNSFSPELHWDNLVVRKLDLGEIEGMSLNKGSNPKDLLAEVMNKIIRLEQRLKRGNMEVQSLDDDIYFTEQRLYIKGLRERTNKADSEALEKATFKQKCDEIQRVIDYENRCKKRSIVEIEYEELLRRPIQFEANISRTRNDACKIGESCDICRYDLAHQLFTATEMKAAGGDIKVAVNNIALGHESQFIPCLRFKRIRVSDLPNDRHENEDDDHGQSDNSIQCNVITRRGSGSDATQLWNLYELKHTLEFMIRFNAGLLTSK